MANFAKKEAVKRQRVVTLDKEYGFTLFHKWMVINCCTLMTDNEKEEFKGYFPKSTLDITRSKHNKDLVWIRGFMNLKELDEYMDRQAFASLHVKLNRVQKAYLEAKLKCDMWDDKKDSLDLIQNQKGFVGIDIVQPAKDDLPS